MKKISILFIIPLSLSIASCQEVVDRDYSYKVAVVDEEGTPVEDANVRAMGYELIPDSPIPVARSFKVNASTDPSGVASISFSSPQTPGGVAITKDGYYQTTAAAKWVFPEGFLDTPGGHVGKMATTKIEAVLKPVKNPIPMIARKDLRILTPDLGVSYGFDLEMGDSLPPLGNGKHADIEFILTGTREDLGDGNKEHVDFQMEIKCPNPDDGFVQFSIEDSKEFNKGSALPSAHECPKEGYSNKLLREYKNDKDGGMVEAYRIKHEIANQCAYFRVRTERDEDGNIVSAHYGKLYGPLEIRPALKLYGHYTGDAQGGFFIHHLYFNPTPNDRNVEFDPSRNLLPDGKVRQP